MPTKITFNLKTSYVGQCQACFQKQVIKATGGSTKHTLVLHGYSRPGFGYIHGQCSGVNHEPYELSCEYTKEWKSQCENYLVTRREYLKQLKANKVDKLNIYLLDYSQQVGWGEKRKGTWTEIGRDFVGADRRNGDWDSHYRAELRDVAKDVESTAETIVFLTGRIEAWKFAPELLRDHATVEREEREAKAADRMYRAWFRRAKDSWKRLGEAINDHKRGYGLRDEGRAAFMRDNQFPSDKERKKARENANS